MDQPTPLLATADNYAVGKVNSVGNVNYLVGIYQKYNGTYLRLKVHLGDEHLYIMEPAEVHQFPEYYDFHSPTATVRRNRGNRMRGRS